MKEYLLGKVEEFPEGKGRAFKAGTRTVAVFRATGSSTHRQSLHPQGRLDLRRQYRQRRQERSLPVAQLGVRPRDRASIAWMRARSSGPTK